MLPVLPGPDSNKIALEIALDMLHEATCLATLRKVEDSLTFSATCNAAICLIPGCKNGVLHVNFFAVKLKIASCNVALGE